MSRCEGHRPPTDTHTSTDDALLLTLGASTVLARLLSVSAFVCSGWLPDLDRYWDVQKTSCWTVCTRHTDVLVSTLKLNMKNSSTNSPRDVPLCAVRANSYWLWTTFYCMFDCEILLTITGRRSDQTTPPPCALRSSVRYCYTNRPAHYSVSCLMRLSVFNLYRHCAGAQRRVVFGCAKYRTAVANVQELLGLRSRSPHARISGQKCCAEFTDTCVSCMCGHGLYMGGY